MRIPESLHSHPQPAGVESYLASKELGAVKVGELARRFLSFLRCAWSSFFIGMGFLLISSICLIVVPRITGWIVDDALLAGKQEVLYWYIGLLVLAEAGRFVGAAGQTYFFNDLGQRVMQEIRVRLFDRFLRLPLPTIDSTPHGALVTRLTTDVSYLAEMFQMGFIQTIKDMVTVLVAMLGMCLLDVQLTVLSLLGFPVLYLFARVITPRLFAAHREVRRTMAGMNALLTDVLGAASVVCVLNLRDLFTRRARWLVEAIADGQLERVRANALFHPFTTLVTAVGGALLFIVGYMRIEEGTLGEGELVAFLAYLLMIFWPLVHMVNRFDVFLSGLASLERIFDALDWSIEEDGEGDPVEEETFEGRVEFRDVWFAYEEPHWVLRDLSFVVEPGMHVGIVGPTGSGKSTLVNLLLRFYEPQRGQILLDGRDIRSYSKRSLRKRFGFVHQDAYVFPGTVAENVSLWQEDDRKVLQETLANEAFAVLGDPERELEGGGGNLSAGMRQVLSFARNLYRRPGIWVLDEATAHLDPELDEQLNALLSRFGGARTALIIAHRLSSIQQSNLILVLKDGQLLEQGNHEALMEAGGFYANLHRVQQRLLEDTEVAASA